MVAHFTGKTSCDGLFGFFEDSLNAIVVCFVAAFFHGSPRILGESVEAILGISISPFVGAPRWDPAFDLTAIIIDSLFHFSLP